MTGEGSAGLPARIYDDAVSPAAKEVGATIAVAVRLALSPANFVLRTAQEAFDYAQNQVQERFTKWRTDPADVVPPPPEVVGPVVQALQYINDDSSLHDMFLNLLARAMDKNTQGSIHPAFAEVIRQLSPPEARLLPHLPLDQRAVPLVEARLTVADGGYHTLQKHINPLGAKLRPETIVRRPAIDNLARVGVLAFHDLQSLQNPDLYAALEASPAARAVVEVAAERGEKVVFHRYLAEVTDFGVEFLRAVLDPVVRPAANDAT